MKFSLQKLILSLLMLPLIAVMLLSQKVQAESTDAGFLTYKSGAVEFLANTGKTMKLGAIGTGGINIIGNGKVINKFGQAPYVPVFAATAVAETNILVPGYNVAAATATANHLVLVGNATTIPDAEYNFYNASASSLKLKMPPGVTMNGATAGGTLVVAAKTGARCKVVSATDIECELKTSPTAAAA